MKSFNSLSKSQKNRRIAQEIARETLYTTSEAVPGNYSLHQQMQSANQQISNVGAGLRKDLEPYTDNGSDDEYENVNFANEDNKPNLPEALAAWHCKFNQTIQSTKALLIILKDACPEEFKRLPSDPRTLLHTPRSTVIRDVPNGKYFHNGLKNGLINQLSLIDITDFEETIHLNIDIDGLPISKSSRSEFFPILGEIYPKLIEPFVIGIYHGKKKPLDCNDFLAEFIEEYNLLRTNGFIFKNKVFKVKIRAVITDAVAKSYIKCTKSHTGYFGCGKCTTEGTFVCNRMTYADTNSKLRTDEDFLNHVDDDHHTGHSIFETTDIGLVSQFLLDYMHLACIGQTKKIFQLLMDGVDYEGVKIKFSSNVVQEISSALSQIGEWLPSDFARKTRSLDEISRYKATELRVLALYIGPIVLQKRVPKIFLKHFIYFYTALRILCDEKDCIENNQYAKNLLKCFVRMYENLYGKENVTYNVHNLIHLADDALRFGPLDSFSAFSFENYMHCLKQQLHHGDNPLQQVHRRSSERVKCLQKFMHNQKKGPYPKLHGNPVS